MVCCEGPDGHPTLFGDVATGLGGEVWKNRTRDGGCHKIYIYTHLFTKGSSSPRHVPKHTTHTYRPYSQVLQYSVPWAPACPKVQSQAPFRPKPGPNLGTETHLKLSTLPGQRKKLTAQKKKNPTQNKTQKKKKNKGTETRHTEKAQKTKPTKQGNKTKLKVSTHLDTYCFTPLRYTGKAVHLFFPQRSVALLSGLSWQVSLLVFSSGTLLNTQATWLN